MIHSNVKIPKEFYDKESIMQFVYYVYKRQQIEPHAFAGIKFPYTLEISVSHIRGHIIVKYWRRAVGYIDLFDERISYVK